MDDDEVVNPLGVPTTNYGWTKPTVGADVDVWGGYLNADLDGIDTTVKSVSTVANAAYPASNPAGYITAAAIPAPYVLPTASTSVLGGVKVDGSTIAINSGVISAAGASITVSDTAPSSPQPGALWYDSVGGQLYVWYADPNTSQWVPATNQMGGGYATQAYVDSSVNSARLGDNRLVNGDMRIDQRNGGASGTANGYTIDRWYFIGSSVKGTWGRSLNAVAGPSGFPYYLGFQSSSAYTSLAADVFFLMQTIEADMISDFAFGLASAQLVTLSFLVYSSLTGTFGASLQNAANTRSYPFTYSIPVASTWTKITVTIPGDTGGTWVMSGNARSAQIIFDLGTGATQRGPAGVWASANYTGVTGSVSVVATNAATFYLTGVKLEIGTVATPYNRQSLAKSMADCQRYYQTSNVHMVLYNAVAAAIFGHDVQFPVSMRASPTIVYPGPTYLNASGIGTNQAFPSGFIVFATGTAVGTSNFLSGFTASAEL